MSIARKIADLLNTSGDVKSESLDYIYPLLTELYSGLGLPIANEVTAIVANQDAIHTKLRALLLTQAGAYQRGDIDNDGDIDVSDMIAVLRWIIGLEDGTPIESWIKDKIIIEMLKDYPSYEDLLEFRVYRLHENGGDEIVSVSSSGITVDGNVSTGTGSVYTSLVISDAHTLWKYDNTAAITGDAVDIFIYDTSKDSDGGAWRKRTQDTSWYNETASTTRGSRKEFPAVAVIVLESQGMTIYDGDTPDLDMWMVFQYTANGWNALDYGGGLGQAVTMMNGVMAIGNSIANYGSVQRINFISEEILCFLPTAFKYDVTIANRNPAQAGAFYNVSATYGSIVNKYVNDVAITVLPNAPIDSATGLPTPTIAVATDGGVSVIKDDGTVINLLTEQNAAYSNTRNMKTVSFGSDYRLTWASAQHNGLYENAVITKFPIWRYVSSTTSYSKNPDSYSYEWSGAIYSNTTQNNGTSIGTAPNPEAAGTIYSQIAGDDWIIYGDKGLFSIPQKSMDRGASVLAYITSKYNTGYMTGDIRGAWNVDTDVTSLSGTELVTNYDFASTDVSYISNSANGTATVSGSQLVLSGGTAGYSDHVITLTGLTVGQFYNITIEQITSAGTGTGKSGFYVNGVYLADTNTGATYANRSNGSYSWFFIPDHSSENIDLVVSGGITDTITFDNWSIKEAIPDRSVKGNGLAVHGTPTVSAVATGAELKCISGFSSSNYLEQPYNSDLDFGTGDFSFSGWVKPDAISNRYLFQREGAETGSNILFLPRYSSGILFNVAGTYSTSGTTALQVDKWHNFFVGREGAVVKIYIDGELVSTASGSTTNLSSTNATLTVGNRKALTSHYEGSLALFRVSKTFATAEQIKEIYEAEKPLFQENAKCTLNGTSDAVTAMSYDDSNEELLVGTSGGLSVFKGLRRVDENTNNITEVAQQGGLRVEEY